MKGKLSAQEQTQKQEKQSQYWTGVTEAALDKFAGDDPDVPGRTGPMRKRRRWILRELAKGVELRISDVCEEFECSRKTAQRDLMTLKERRLIKFVGSTRTGHYQLVANA